MPVEMKPNACYESPCDQNHVTPRTQETSGREAWSHQEGEATLREEPSGEQGTSGAEPREDATTPSRQNAVTERKDINNDTAETLSERTAVRVREGNPCGPRVSNDSAGTQERQGRTDPDSAAVDLAGKERAGAKAPRERRTNQGMIGMGIPITKQECSESSRDILSTTPKGSGWVF